MPTPTGPTDRAEPATRSTTTICEASAPAHWRGATALLWDYVTWIREASGLDPLVEQPSLAAELDGLAAAYAGSDAVFFVALDAARCGRRPGGERIVGTVAVRHHPDRTSELKRLYVAPDHRRRGLAHRLVERAVAAAADRRSVTIWLESVQGFMDAAIALYEHHGFEHVVKADRSFDVPGMVVMDRPLDGSLSSGPPS